MRWEFCTGFFVSSLAVNGDPDLHISYFVLFSNHSCCRFGSFNQSVGAVRSRCQNRQTTCARSHSSLFEKRCFWISMAISNKKKYRRLRRMYRKCKKHHRHHPRLFMMPDWNRAGSERISIIRTKPILMKECSKFVSFELWIEWISRRLSLSARPNDQMTNATKKSIFLLWRLWRWIKH